MSVAHAKCSDDHCAWQPAVWTLYTYNLKLLCKLERGVDNSRLAPTSGFLLTTHKWFSHPFQGSHHVCSNDLILSAEGRCLSTLTSFVTHGWMVCFIVTFDISVEYYVELQVLIWSRWTTPRNEPHPTPGVPTFPGFLYKSKKLTKHANKTTNNNIQYKQTFFIKVLFIHQLKHQWVVFKTILKFTLKQLRHVSVLQLHRHQGGH